MLNDATLAAMAVEPYELRGILHSEMALVIHACQARGVRMVIESGRARGQSTYMLAKYLPDVEIHSVELRDHPDEQIALERLAGLNNVVLHHGDGANAVPFLAQWANGNKQRVAILLDGPKGAAAVDILDRCFEFPHVVIGFIHDLRRLDHGGPSPHRAIAVERLPYAKFTDDPRLIGARWMDAGIIAAGGPAGPAHEAEFGSYGPTLGVFENHKH